MITITDFPYTHRYLGPLCLTPDSLEFQFLKYLGGVNHVATASLEFAISRWPFAKATGFAPYLVLEGSSGESNKLMTGEAGVKHVESLFTSIENEEFSSDPFVNLTFSRFLRQQLGLIVKYFVWMDDLVVEEWTMPILCSSLLFGTRSLFLWQQRSDFESRIVALLGHTHNPDSTEDLMLSMLEEIVRFCTTNLARQQFMCGSRPGVLDGIIFAHFSVLFSCSVADHDGLSSVLLKDNLIVEYLRRVNHLQRGGIWSNDKTFLCGIYPTEAPYPKSPNSARKLREAKKQLRVPIEPQITAPQSNTKFQKMIKNPLLKIWRKIRDPTIVVGSPRKLSSSDPLEKELRPEIFLAISAGVVCFWLMSGRSPFQFE